MKKLLTRKIVEQDMKCGICGEPFMDCTEIVPDHILPKEWGRHGETTIPITSVWGSSWAARNSSTAALRRPMRFSTC